MAMENKEISRQERNGKFVETEVICCQSMLVEMLLEKEIASYEDIENIYKTPEDMEDEGYTKEEIEAGDGNAKEILEWWVVSDYMERQLRALGYPLLVTDYGTWWGRCTSGQAICLDYTIDRIIEKGKKDLKALGLKG